MKLTSEQIAAIRNAAPELADKLEAGESVTVEREVKRWEPDRFAISAAVIRSKEAAAIGALLAYREEFAPGYVVPEIGSYAFFPVFDGEEWETGGAFTFRSASEVYMPKDVCEALCRKLNSGEVVL